MKRIGAVILAAGGSARLGRPKQLLVLDGETLLRRIARGAIDAGANPVIVVLGAVVGPCRATLEGLDVRVVENPAWREGLATSLAAGVAALGEVDGALLLLCDQPSITPDTLRRIMAAFAGDRIVAAGYAGTVGTPAIFPSEHFSALGGLTGDAGAKRLLQRHERELIVVDLPEAVVDIDSAGDWEKFRQN
ncbi:hypothetical protein AYO41_02310 [Verrucomicrobia bacterium SCGC AG-212-E04]|nr:hypothetical protein AYO41_02310 [Verrucomicrobia bacterium SCGC AG-212-E04]